MLQFGEELERRNGSCVAGVSKYKHVTQQTVGAETCSHGMKQKNCSDSAVVCLALDRRIADQLDVIQIYSVLCRNYV